MFHGGSSFRKFSIFFSKFQKGPKSFPKVSKRVLNLFWVNFFEKFFLPSVAWRVEFSKIFKKIYFQNSKNAQKCSQDIQTCFSVIFSKKNYAQCSMEGRFFENFQIFFPKFQKGPKSFPKVSKRVLNMFWGKFFEKIFCPVFLGGSSFRKFSTKKYFQNSKMPKSVPKSLQTCFEHVLGQTF